MSARPQFSTHLPPQAIDWLARGERGISSETLFSVIYGVPAEERRGCAHREGPYDPADFRRCRLMVQGIPGAQERLRGIIDVKAPPIARAVILEVVEQWDLLCAVMDAEAPSWAIPPNGDTAPRLYVLLQDIRMKAEAAHQRASLHSNGYARQGGADGHPAMSQDVIEPAKAAERAEYSRRTLPHRLRMAMMAPVMLDRETPFPRLRALYGAAKDLVTEFAGSTHDPSGRLEGARRSIEESERTHVGASRDAHFNLRVALLKAMDALWDAGRFHAEASDELAPVRTAYEKLERAVREQPPPSVLPRSTARRPRP